MQYLFTLPNFPDYLFSETGDAQRKEPVKRGLLAGQTKVPCFTCDLGSIHYRLYDLNGKRTSVRQEHLAQAIQDQDTLSVLKPIPGFDVYLANESGIPYSVRRSGTLHKLKPVFNGDQIRYVLYDSSRKRRTLSAPSILRLQRLYNLTAQGH